MGLFREAIKAGDSVGSALKDMAVVMKQLDRAEEAIEAIKSFRHLCSHHSQQSLDNLLIDLYKVLSSIHPSYRMNESVVHFFMNEGQKCGRTEEQMELIKRKLRSIYQLPRRRLPREAHKNCSLPWQEIPSFHQPRNCQITGELGVGVHPEGQLHDGRGCVFFFFFGNTEVVFIVQEGADDRARCKQGLQFGPLLIRQARYHAQWVLQEAISGSPPPRTPSQGKERRN